MSALENSQKFMGDLISLHDGGSDHDDDQTLNSIMKILSIVIILSVTVVFGFFPYFW